MLLVLTAPVMAVAAVLIKPHDRGPVLFRQVRIGRDGEPFTLIKLRTMEVDAEARLAELRHRNERHGPLFKVSSDPRITPIGRLLRSTAIDELPQLFNVLTGRMSIVGPRPALPAETAEFDDELKRRNVVRPASPACGRSRPTTRLRSRSTGGSTSSMWTTGRWRWTSRS